MSRFTEEDQERIRSQLVDAGRELFAQFGFERTRVSDVTETVGIGTSTFYQFFDSKEALYVEVLCAERDWLVARINEAVAAADTPKDEVRAMLRTMFREIRSNRLISRLIVDGELRDLEDQLSYVERQSITASAREEELADAKRWAQLDEFRYDDPEFIRGLFQSLVFITRSQDAVIGAENGAAYERIEQELIETIVDGLFCDGS